MKIYKTHNGSIVVKPYDIPCTGGHMEELVPNTTDAAGEKHVPVITIDGAKVTVAVGEVEHPMLDNHYITCIILETNLGYSVRELAAGAKPCAVFALAEGETA
ncbi:MAG: desulfoferrodoxin, partial [Saccharofermentans sp.]|nr:desulfoferrodoxin [Saccharofermentans sp.]